MCFLMICQAAFLIKELEGANPVGGGVLNVLAIAVDDLEILEDDSLGS